MVKPFVVMTGGEQLKCNTGKDINKMNINDQAIETILNAIRKEVAFQGDKLTYDKTLQGHITTVLPDNRYSLKIHGKEYPHVPSCLDMNFGVNESVWVTVPQGNWNQMFICGRRK